MRNIIRIITIIILLIVICSIYLSEHTSSYAQEASDKSALEPNESDIMDMLKKKINQIETENMIKYLQDHPEEVNEPKLVHLNEVEVEQKMALRIEADNIRYKDRIFGNPFCGLSMSIEPVNDEYEIGDDIEISTLCKNFSNEKKELMRERYYGNIEDCSYVMYYSDGTPVPKSELIEKYEANINIPPELPRVSSEEIINLRPRQIYSFLNNRIDRYFKIEEEGTYSLIIMRNITGTWKDGFMISNMIKIKIVKKK